METTLDHFIGLISKEIVLILFIASVVLWLYAIIDLLKRNFERNNKLIWVFVILFLPIVGSILYLSMGRKQKKI